MGDPADRAADGKDAGEGVPRECQRVEQERGVELHIDVERTAGFALFQDGERALFNGFRQTDTVTIDLTAAAIICVKAPFKASARGSRTR